MAEFDQVVFGKKKFSDILQEIYTRSTTKEKQISDLIEQLKELIQNTGDAVMMVPLIASYMDLNLKNDDALIKMAAIVQKAMTRGKETGDFLLPDSEKEELLKLVEEYVASPKYLAYPKIKPSSAYLKTLRKSIEFYRFLLASTRNNQLKK